MERGSVDGINSFKKIITIIKKNRIRNKHYNKQLNEGQA